jgi:membrane-bound ClpP family serine protease
MLTQSKLNIWFLGFTVAFLAFIQLSTSELASDWQYWAFRIAKNPLVIGIAICIGLAIKKFKVTLVLGIFSLIILSLIFLFDSNYTWMMIFLTASFVVVTSVIAIVNLVKHMNCWILKIE